MIFASPDEISSFIARQCWGKRHGPISLAGRWRGRTSNARHSPFKFVDWDELNAVWCKSLNDPTFGNAAMLILPNQTLELALESL